jgi:hypothetical protein
VFNGSRFCSEIAPRIADFVLSHNGRRSQYGNDAAKVGTAKVGATQASAAKLAAVEL